MEAIQSFTISLRGFPSGSLYLKGPRAPHVVRKLGYSFTDDPTEAWPFPSEKQAQAKGRIVARHMGVDEGKVSIQ